jgi:hypothetical protein
MCNTMMHDIMRLLEFPCIKAAYIYLYMQIYISIIVYICIMTPYTTSNFYKL